MTICARLIIETSVVEVVKMLSMKDSLKKQIELVSRMIICARLIIESSVVEVIKVLSIKDSLKN